MRPPGWRRLRRSRRLAPVRRALQPAVRPVRDWRDRRQAEAEVRAILDTGVFDQDWYEAQTGLRFDGADPAVRHYLEHGHADGTTPHPLFEPDTLYPGWADRRDDPLLRYLAAPERISRSPHPAFHPPGARAQLRAAGVDFDGPGAWWAWVRSATPDSPFPAVDGFPSVPWADVRQDLLDAARAWRHRRRLAEPLQVVTDFRAPEAAPASRQRPLPEPDAPPADSTQRVPKVSVVIATWNRSGTLRRAIASVQAQTSPDWEIVVSDDGSDDDTAAVVAGIAHFDPRVRYLALPRSGVSAARNAGLRLARGRYVAFIDSDNTWRPDFLRVMVEAMDGGGWLAAYAALQVNRGGTTVYRATEGSRESLLLGNYIDLNVLLLRRELIERIGGFDESLRRAVDYDLVLRVSEHTELRLVGTVGADYSDQADDPRRISSTEPYTWNHVVRARHLIDWQAVAGQQRVPGRTSVVVPVGGQTAATLDWLSLVQPRAARKDRLDLELILVGFARRSQFCVTTARAAGLPVRLVLHAPKDRISLLTDIGVAASTGSVVVAARPNASLSRRSVGLLAAALDDASIGVVQPLVERTDMTVASAGGVFGPSTLHPTPLLEGFPVADAERLGDVDLPAALGPVVALRAADLVALHGFDPIFGNTMPEVDLSWRAREAGFGMTRLVVRARARATAQKRAGFPHDSALSVRLLAERWRRPPTGSDALWRRAGFDVSYRPIELAGTGHHSEKTWGLQPVPTRRPTVAVSAGVPRLRWTIDIAAPSGPRGDAWGDRHFAQSLARALQARGQSVAVDHREARHRESRVHDDVLLVIRGLDEVFPAPGPVNLLWIISHPDAVQPWEAARYDAVFAASTIWAAERTAAWGLPVSPLLQCTDPALFHPDRGVPDTGPPILFVGNARKVFRPIVQHALASGGDLAVYGGGWEPFIEAHVVRGTHVPNTELGGLYASAGLVLNDHWDDMRRCGFLSNRLFDAVACGARVVTDPVPGLAETFGGSVCVADSQADMDRVVKRPYRDHFPLRDERVAQARRVLNEHSFAARAAELLTAALRIRQGRAVAVDVDRRDPQSTLRRW